MDGGTLPRDAPADPEDAAASSSTRAFEQAVAQPVTYDLVLYIAGHAPRSLRALRSTKKMCEEHLSGRYDLEVVDIYQQPHLAEQAGILAVPALVKRQPPPLLCFVGDMTDLGRVLDGLGLTVGGGSGEPG